MSFLPTPVGRLGREDLLLLGGYDPCKVIRIHKKGGKVIIIYEDNRGQQGTLTKNANGTITAEHSHNRLFQPRR